MSVGDTLTPASSLETYINRPVPVSMAVNMTLGGMNSSYSTPSSSSMVNVTTLKVLLSVLEYHVPYAIAINKCITPIWYVIGSLGNILSATIWLHPRFRTFNSAAYYLASLAIADQVYLLLHVFYELQNPWLIRSLDLQVWCQTWNLLYMAAQYICVLLVFAFTVERFLSICHPFRSERFSRTSRSPRVIGAIVTISIVFAIPQAYFWEMNNFSECTVRHMELVRGEKSFYSIWSWGSEMIVFAVVPVLVLLANICVLRKMRYVGQLKCKDASTSNTVNNIRYVSTTVTLLWVSFFLIFTTLPVTIMFAIQSKIRLGDSMSMKDMATSSKWQSYFTYYTARAIIKEIGMSHHVFNVLIYCLTSRRFRRRIMYIVWGPVPCSTRGSGREDSWRNPCPSPKETSKMCLNSR